MGLTSLSVLLAVLVLNVHLYGSTLKPVPRRLRQILIHHVAPCLLVKLHRKTIKDRRNKQYSSSSSSARRSTTVYNAVFLNDSDLARNSQSSSYVFRSRPVAGRNLTRTRISPTDAQSTPQSLHECKRLLFELNRLILHAGDTREEDNIIRDWQNVALVIDRCLFYIYLIITTVLTTLTLVLAPLMKTIPSPPEYFLLNITKV